MRYELNQDDLGRTRAGRKSRNVGSSAWNGATVLGDRSRKGNLVARHETQNEATALTVAVDAAQRRSAELAGAIKALDYSAATTSRRSRPPLRLRSW
jgi:hypothetical protein